jgi:hypothetical protein
VFDVVSAEIVQVRVGRIRDACVLGGGLSFVGSWVFRFDHLFFHVESESLQKAGCVV